VPALECPGVFIAAVPDGWTASGRPGEFYELQPPGNDAAVHISVYNRDGQPLRDHEARDVLALFLNRALGSAGGEIRALAEGPAQQRAFARLTKATESGELTGWFTACIIWPKSMLICSFAGSPGHSSVAPAERMFASIAPAGNDAE